MEAIVNTMIPKEVEKPIPTRTVTTRFKNPQPKIAGQPITNDSANSQEPAESSSAAESVRLSPQLSALARKEQAFRQREQALKDREKEMEQKLLQAEKYDQLKQKLQSKDFSEAEELGLNYEDYTGFKLNAQGETDPNKERIQALEAKLSDFEKKAEESAASLYEETVAEYRSEIKKLVANDPEYSSVKGLEGEEAVLQLILDTFEEEGEELTVAEASKLVEDQLTERGKRYNSLPKFQKQEIAEEEAPQPRALPRPIMGKTLTNDMTVASEKRPLKSLQHLSEAERYAEARRRVLERREKGK